MLEGKVLGARFVLREELDHDIPGIQRFLAHDERLDRATVVDLIDSPEAAAVRNVATRASRLRDPRLARVVATGTEELDGASVTYIASEHVPGSRLDTVLAERVLDPRRAVAVVGGAARALAAARAEDLHHGILRPRCITVTERGRVVVAGVGIEAAAAARAGMPTDPSEHGDARVLGEILIRALTGADVGVATEADLPDALAARPRRLAAQILAGDGPRSLDQVIVSLSPFDSRALVGFSSVWPVLDLTPEKERERLESEERAATAAEAARQERLAATREMLDEDTLPAAEAAVAAAVAVEHASPELQETVRQIEEQRVETGEQPEVAPEPPAEDALPPGAHVQPDGAADKYEAGFDTLEIMVAAQNVTRDQSTWELVLERLSARWPQSRSLARSLERAQERANSGGPLDGSKIVMLLAVIGVVAAVMLAWSLLDSPLDPSIRIEIDPTFTPAGDVGTASPSPSPSAG
ncbi:hypothetical protein [Demequina lignilytica]|uniref:Protein kinase domain-containing protein n=1 Tax=Demequina lignilytica TaxID=3051663 RepID=A0AB35MI60_9MICO|nr:hypothetical protein [Demequina sp. SYSU T0a273]MDN4483458.1 hypothetical protein [Demequina sp. SYSU T0a273]